MSTQSQMEMMAQLKALGISEKTAHYALFKTDNDIAKAADYDGGPLPGENSRCRFWQQAAVKRFLGDKESPLATDRSGPDAWGE
nr:hypothetical protein L203_05804 [Cryptococcus depauperatus CBS 7841]